MNGPRRPPAHNPEADALVGLAVLAAVVVVLAGLWGAAQLAAAVEGTAKPAGNPVAFVTSLVKGSFHWPAAATTWAIGEGAVVVALAVLVGSVLWRWQGRRVYVDRRARLLPRDLPSLRRYIDPKAAPVAGEHGGGPQVGRDVMGGRMVRATWEDTLVAIAGARMGKTTSMAVPQVLDAARRRLLHEQQTRPGGPDREGPAKSAARFGSSTPKVLRAPRNLGSGGTRSTPARRLWAPA